MGNGVPAPLHLDKGTDIMLTEFFFPAFDNLWCLTAARYTGYRVAQKVSIGCCHSLTDFQNSFSGTLNSEFIITWLLNTVNLGWDL